VKIGDNARFTCVATAGILNSNWIRNIWASCKKDIQLTIADTSGLFTLERTDSCIERLIARLAKMMFKFSEENPSKNYGASVQFAFGLKFSWV